MPEPARHRDTTALHPKQLMHSKWTAVSPRQREKHFLVTRVVEPDAVGGPIEWVDLEAVLSRRVERLRWRELADASAWLRGWQ